ncbi:MAG: TonB-dependent receptor [Ignavibacteriaceae bacterium]|nr:TonB-dependent receptor [Ignavibacteriaceae bacterium]
MHRIFSVLSILALIIILSPRIVSAAGANLAGAVTDAVTGEPLLGANVVLMGTGKGAATDNYGKFNIPNINPGIYKLKVSYIGYLEQNTSVTLEEGAKSTLNFKLEPVGIVGETIVVTSQATGQTEAINQQLSSIQIMDVVSSTRIQELPDATVAEALGRLPGISVLRSGGEGDEVVIRGLAPKYNKIMIDGVDMSSSNAFDRSQDLSSISSNMLEGISVTKSVTADMDADVIGGTINFQLREAKIRNSTSPMVNFLLQGAYDNLPDEYNRTNNYKYIISVENRFYDNLLGVFAQADIERRNLASNEFGALYTNNGLSTTQYLTSGFILHDIPRDRLRYNGAVVLDYKIPDGKIKLSNFLSNGTTDVIDRNETYNINSGSTSNQHLYGLNYSNIQLSQINNLLEYDQILPIFHVNAKLSHTYSETKDPNDWSASFIQTSAGLLNFINVPNLNPIDIPKQANNNLAQTYLNTITTSNSFARRRALTGSLDLDANVNVSDLISAVVKFGGKFKHETSSYAYQIFDGGGLSLGSAVNEDNLLAQYLNFPSNLGTNIPIGLFADPSFKYGKFLNGDYNMISPLNFSLVSAAANFLRNNAIKNGGTITFGKDNYLSDAAIYNGYENQSAAYLMTIVNVGPDITVIPGVRYQNLQTNYTSPHVKQPAQSFQPDGRFDTTVTQSHGYWLPDLSLRYKVTPWCDVRLSYSSTLAYPDYQALVPKVDVALNGQINYNNYDMVPSRSDNYDGYVSFYENTLGLFTIGGFYKQIDNLIYPWSFIVTSTEAVKYYPARFITSPLNQNFQINTYVNDPYKVDDYGIELDWQTHFWYLPGPLSSLVLNVNYTHIFSKAQYPYQYGHNVNRVTTYVDTSFVDKLLDQPNDIINLSLGFDYSGFSARISMLSQSEIFTGPNFWPQLRPSTATYTRWDLSLKQELPWFNIQVFGDVNNLNGAHDVSVLPIGNVPQSQQDYGLTADLGFRIHL